MRYSGLQENYKAGKTPRRLAADNVTTNHPVMIQVRDGPIEERVWWSHMTDNPEHLGASDWRSIPRGMSFPDLQQVYGGMMRANTTRLEIENFGTHRRARKVLQDVTHADSVPTFTMGSDWFKEVHESVYKANGEGRIMVNNSKTYYG